MKETKLKQNFLKYILLLIALIASILTLSSCGFRPVYKQYEESENQNSIFGFLENVYIEPIDSVDGVHYYNHLKNIFPPHKTPKYKLETEISYEKDYSIIQKNSDVLREFVTILVEYKLIEYETEKIITSNKFSRLISFGTNFSPYSNQINQRDTQKMLAIMAAEEVRDRIILFLENK